MVIGDLLSILNNYAPNATLQIRTIDLSYHYIIDELWQDKKSNTVNLTIVGPIKDKPKKAGKRKKHS